MGNCEKRRQDITTIQPSISPAKRQSGELYRIWKDNIESFGSLVNSATQPSRRQKRLCSMASTTADWVPQGTEQQGVAETRMGEYILRVKETQRQGDLLAN